MKNKILYLIPMFLLLIFLLSFGSIRDFMISQTEKNIENIYETTGQIILSDVHDIAHDMWNLLLGIIALSIILKLVLTMYLKKQGISINKGFKIITNIIYIFIILTLCFFVFIIS